MIAHPTSTLPCSRDQSYDSGHNELKKMSSHCSKPLVQTILKADSEYSMG